VLLLAFEASLNIERQLKFAVLPSFRLVLPESRRVGSFGIEKREESNYEANRKIQIGQTETFTFTLSFQTDLLTELGEQQAKSGSSAAINLSFNRNFSLPKKQVAKYC